MSPASRARDVVIVGGGPAGSTTAIALLRAAPSLAGRVMILERAAYPREKFCAGALGGRGDKILRELGAVPEVPCAPVDGISLRTADAEVAARLVPAAPNGAADAPGAGAVGRVVRRIEFDHALAKLAAARGVEVLDGTRVDALRLDGSGGVAVETSRGPMHARVVVGADGVGSVVRKAMGLGGGTLRAQVLELDTEPASGDRDRRLLHFDAADRRLSGYTWDFPTVVEGRELVCRGIYRLKVAGDDEGPEIQTLLAERLAAMGLDLSRYKNKRYAERGYDPVERVARGPLMLVGEAAGIDPVTGEGIAQAIEYGSLAGEFLGRALLEAGDAPPRLADWDRVMSGSRLARDLRIRNRFVRLFYGAPRPEVERFLTESPDALYVGCQHFAGVPYDLIRLSEVLVRGGARVAGLFVDRALSA